MTTCIQKTASFFVDTNSSLSTPSAFLHAAQTYLNKIDRHPLWQSSSHKGSALGSTSCSQDNARDHLVALLKVEKIDSCTCSCKLLLFNRSFVLKSFKFGRLTVDTLYLYVDDVVGCEQGEQRFCPSLVSERDFRLIF